jgi:DNA polymerase I
MTPLEEANTYLISRGVLVQTAAEFRVETVITPNPEQLSSWLGYDGYSLEAAIVFPNLVVNPDTAAISIHNYSVRCFPPPVWTDGKEHKFLSTRGSGYRPYILPPVLDHAFDTNRVIYITEKQTAALLLHQNGLSAIAFDGTWGAAQKREDGQPVKFHPILAEFDWIGRSVYLCFDSDFRSRTNVLWGLIRAYILFSIAGAVVRLVQWNPALKGVEDYVAAKAGLDPAAQRLELDTLTATVSDLSASVAAGKWIIPQYRTLFEREMAAIVPGMAERSQLAECLHEALGTTTSDLKKSWGIAAKPAPEKTQNTPTYPIPEVWPDPVNYSEVMFGVLSDFTNPRFIVITEEQAVVCTIHTMTTYLTEHLDDWLHFLYITAGAKESGKTKLLCLFFELCYWASLRGDPTAPAIYYDLREGPHTMLIDEVDKKEQNREAILDLINYSTTRQTAWVSRVDMDAKRVVYFPTFCPKILAGIGRLRGTTASRCIEIQMLKKAPGGPRIRIKKEDRRKFEERRSQMMRIATGIGPGLSDYDIDTLRLPPGISDREADNWTLLFLTAELIGGPWPGLLHRAFSVLCPPKNPDASDDSDGLEYGEALVRDLARIWVETPAVEFYLSEQLLIKLKTMKDRPWAGMRNGLGLSSEKMAGLLRAFPGVKAHRHRIGQGNRHRGYFLVHLLPVFQSYAADIWNPPPPPNDPPNDPSDGSNPPPEPSTPPGEGIGPAAQKSPEEPSTEENKEKPGFEGFQPVPPVPPSVNQGLKPIGWAGQVEKENAANNPVPLPCPTLNPSESTVKMGVGQMGQGKHPKTGVFLNSIPPSTPAGIFCNATEPERLLYFDTEMFYPWPGSGDFPQPSDKTEKQFAKLQKENKAHPWAVDPRRNAIRFLTLWDNLGTFGPEPLTIDMMENPVLPAGVLHALATCTLVGHNLDFDITILRRYGIHVSNAICDTMLASRLLGLGKEKPRYSGDEILAWCDVEPDELEAESEYDPEYDPNPRIHKFEVTVERYLHIKLAKAVTKLGGSDWGRTDITDAQRAYMADDVKYLAPLWTILETELRTASLWHSWCMRMEFFPHLNQIKMTGNPVATEQVSADLAAVVKEKEEVRQELKKIFSDFRYPIPVSRKKQIKIKTENGKFTRLPGPEDEEFSPSNKNHHWIPALACHGIMVENCKEITLRKIDAPECRLLLKYDKASRLVGHMKGIIESTFPDGRVRAEKWNQLAAVTGRIISSGPNLQQVPRTRRNGFRVEPPKLWLKPDLSQIEVVILAVVTGDQYLINLIRNGEDVYATVAAKLFNLLPKRSEEPGCVSEQLRDATKPIVLGGNYGLTPYGFMRRMRDELGLEFSLDEATTFFETFFEMFPGVAAYHQKCLEDALTRTEVRTAAGLRRWLPSLYEPENDYYWPSRDYRKKVLLNTPIQGGQADLQILAVNKFMPLLDPSVEIVNLVHDESDLIVTQDTLQPTIHIVRKAYQDAFLELYGDILIPKINFSLGQSWGETQKIK